MHKGHVQEKPRDQTSQIEMWDARKVVLAGRSQRRGKKNNTLVSELPAESEIHFFPQVTATATFLFFSLTLSLSV